MALLVGGAPQEARAEDAWLARDKSLHFGVSLVIAGSGYGLSAVSLEQPRWRALAGFSVSFGAGAAKELWDLSGRGDASFRDLTWDALGALTGTVLAWGLDRAIARLRPAVGAAASSPRD